MYAKKELNSVAGYCLGKFDRKKKSTSLYGHEEPCTVPYARFCGQSGASAPTDPIR